MPPIAVAAASSVRAGVALMLLGMLLFSLNDVMGKWLVATYSVGQVLLIRSFAGLVALTPFIAAAGAVSLFRIERPGIQALRAALATVEVFCFYAAVQYLPLADAMTYWLAAPIYVAALSPLMLGERVGWRRWTAIVAGFGGVVIAMGPSAATLSPAAVYALAGSLSFGLMILTGRMLRGTPDVALVFWQMAAALAAGVATARHGWVTPDAADLALLSALGVVALTAHFCVNRALKLADAATVSPLQYTLLLWALVFGWLFFGDFPERRMLLGAAIIVGAGLFIFFRERRRAGR